MKEIVAGVEIHSTTSFQNHDLQGNQTAHSLSAFGQILCESTDHGVSLGKEKKCSSTVDSKACCHTLSVKANLLAIKNFQDQFSYA